MVFRKDENWSKLKEGLSKTLVHLTDPIIVKKLYKVEILNEAVLPYIRSMKGNFTLDRERFAQIELLLEILNSDTTVSTNK